MTNWGKQTLILYAILIFFGGLIIGHYFDLTGFSNGAISLTIIDLIFLILAVVSSVLSIVAIVLSWVFYENSQKLNQDANKILSDITQKISKIDEIVTKQFDKVLAKALQVEYEGAVPITDIQLSSTRAPSAKPKQSRNQ